MRYKQLNKVRCAEHIGSATQPSQADTKKPVGAHFRLPGHSHGDICFLPVEKVASKDKFVLEAREEFWIERYYSLKMDTSEKIEHGLNLK